MSSASVKRILAEVRELSALNSSPDAFFTAAPLESDLFEWHFTARGPPDTPFAAGLYHGRILLPPEYPLKAPEILLLTPNGRFEVGTRICLSVTSHHNETWQPSWGVRTILTALVGFMPSKSEGLGALDYPDDERRVLARKSRGFVCERCGVRPAEQFPGEAGGGAGGAAMEKAKREAEELLAGGGARAGASGSASTTTIAGAGVGAAASAMAGATASAGASKSVAAATEREVEKVAAPLETSATETPAIGAEALVSGSGSAVVAEPSVVRARASPGRTRAPPPSEEKELLYLACAIVALIVGILMRRIVAAVA